ncbi:hypothetical protein VNO77_42161 [Canavalia gladiata]|uniref:Uncharacterized protein n=1 Tax=Canavalia gladiata TaxID=3824 RepID=A0AAN9K261_CANGL
MLLEGPSPLPRPKLGAILSHSEPRLLHNRNNTFNDSDEDDSPQQQRPSNATWSPQDTNTNPFSPYRISPFNNQPTLSPLTKSPWNNNYNHNNNPNNFLLHNGLVGSIVREEGHVYSLAVSGDLLYTGSDSKNIRVWKNLKDHTGFKSRSGLVKAIVISNERIFTGHQDGKIRIWKIPKRDQSIHHKRIGSLPTFKDYVKRAVIPKNRNAAKIKHYDAVSCLSLDEENGLLYSASWDKTVKVWSVEDFKCLESIDAHIDAVNAVAVGFEGRVFSGSADGTVKMWRRGNEGKRMKHVLEGILLEQQSAVTALAVNREDAVVYGGSSGGAVNFWEKGGVCHGGVLRGHKLAVLCVAVAGKWVLSGSADGSVCVWKREESGEHAWFSVLAGHSGPVKCITAVEEEDHGDDDDRSEKCMVYTGSLDRSVKVWRVSENAPELRVRKRNVCLTPSNVLTLGVQEKNTNKIESLSCKELNSYLI